MLGLPSEKTTVSFCSVARDKKPRREVGSGRGDPSHAESLAVVLGRWGPALCREHGDLLPWAAGCDTGRCPTGAAFALRALSRQDG